MENGIANKVVQNKQDRRLFVELPWMIYRDDPNWVPPLLTDMHDTLNQDKNALKLGYTRGEGSTIHEFNTRMNIDARKAGAGFTKLIGFISYYYSYLVIKVSTYI